MESRKDSLEGSDSSATLESTGAALFFEPNKETMFEVGFSIWLCMGSSDSARYQLEPRRPSALTLTEARGMPQGGAQSGGAEYKKIQ